MYRNKESQIIRYFCFTIIDVINILKFVTISFQDTTLSDISSHSSGFSSTEGHSDTNRNAKHITHSAVDYEHSTEIINSLQTLNTEIRDIWQVLNSQQQMNVAKGKLLFCTNIK